MNIELARQEDLPGILALQKLCYRESAARYDDYAIQPLTQTLEELEEEWKSHIVLMIKKDGAIIGSVRGHGVEGTCRIGKLVVQPDHQDRGLGSLLMNKIERIFGDVRRYELFTGYRDEKNLYLYDKLGYRPFREKQVHERLKIVFLEKISAVAGG